MRKDKPECTQCGNVIFNRPMIETSANKDICLDCDNANKASVCFCHNCHKETKVLVAEIKEFYFRCAECNHVLWERHAVISTGDTDLRTTGAEYRTMPTNSGKTITELFKAKAPNKSGKKARASKDETIMYVTPGTAYDTIAKKLSKFNGVKIVMPKYVEPTQETFIAALEIGKIEVSGVVTFEEIHNPVIKYSHEIAEEVETLQPIGHADDEVNALVEADQAVLSAEILAEPSIENTPAEVVATKFDGVKPSWADILKKAVTVPGMILEAYSRFHGYSIGNQMLAMFQCLARNIEIGPIASFLNWKKQGRKVKKGEKAIALYMPITGRKSAKKEGDEEGFFTRFILRNNWFVLSQTEGDSVPAATELAQWEKAKALTALEIEETPFNSIDGNSQGYAMERKIAINPIAQLPIKTMFHELAHVVLGHTSELMTDNDRTPRDIREVEAESVALICLESLGLDGANYCRGYIQSWYGANTIPEKNAQRIFSAANKILTAGTKTKKSE